MLNDYFSRIATIDSKETWKPSRRMPTIDGIKESIQLPKIKLITLDNLNQILTHLKKKGVDCTRIGSLELVINDDGSPAMDIYEKYLFQVEEMSFEKIIKK